MARSYRHSLHIKPMPATAGHWHVEAWGGADATSNAQPRGR
jgi:hypothetical protein